MGLKIIQRRAMPAAAAADGRKRRWQGWRRLFDRRLSGSTALTPSARDAARPSFALEQLESRMLLSADILPIAVGSGQDGLDLTLDYDLPNSEIRLIDRTTGDFLFSQRPENDPVVSIDLDSLIGGASLGDHLIVDLSALPSLSSPLTLSIDTGGGGDLVELLNAGPNGTGLELRTGDGADTVHLIGPGLGVADLLIDTGAGDDVLAVADLSVAGAAGLSGGGGGDLLFADMLQGTDDLAWTVDGIDTGTVGGILFDGFENLAGGGDDSDRFVITAAGDLTGGIDGGGGGSDILVIEDRGVGSQALTHALGGAQGGVIASADNSISHDYQGVEQITLAAEADSHTITLAEDANLTLTQTEDGQIAASVRYAFDARTDLGGLDGSDGFRLTGSDPDGRLGYSVGRAGDVNADGFADIIVGQPELDRAAVIFGTDQGFSPSLDPATLDGSNGFLLTGPAGSNTGWAVGGGGDIDGDGFDDLVLGAPGPDGAFSAGAAYVVFGRSTGFSASLDLTTLDGTNGFIAEGIAAGDAAGFSVAFVGDVNVDGFDDLLIGAPGADPDPSLVDAGQAYLVFGDDQGFEATLDLAGLDGKNGFALDGAAAGDAVGSAVASAGDLNSDGAQDVVIGAPGADPNGDGSGAAYVFFGAGDFDVANGLSGQFFDTVDPIASLAEAEAAIEGVIPTSTFSAYQIDYPNSDNADTVDATTGFTDFLGLNAEEIEGGDGATIDGSVFTFAGYLHVAEAGTYTFEVGSSGGYSLNIDGDTVAEVDGTGEFIRTTGVHTFDAAGFYAISLLYFTGDDPAGIELKSDLGGTLDFITREQLYTVPATASYGLAALDGSTGFVVNGVAAGDELGSAVGATGDLNEDGATDVAVGAPGSDVNGADSGQAYVIFGKTLTTIDDGFAAVIEVSGLDGSEGFIFDGAAAGDRTGATVGGAGDLNADGVADLVVGSPGSDANGQAGAAYVVFGDSRIADEGTVNPQDLDGVTGFTATTGETGDIVGAAVAALGDSDGDGIDDLVLGAPGGAGGAYVLLGRVAGGAVTTVTYSVPTSAFVVDGEDAGANITLGAGPTPGPDDPDDPDEIGDVLNFDGADFLVTGENITVAEGAVVSTRQIAAGDDPFTAQSIGDSGDITLRAKNENAATETLTIGKGAALLSNVEDGSIYETGDITIKADATTQTFTSFNQGVFSAAAEGRRTGTITVDEGVSILGGDIDLGARAGILDLANSIGPRMGGFNPVGVGVSFGTSIITELLNLPLSLQVSIVKATVEIGKDGGDAVTVRGTGDVNIEAQALAFAKGEALFWFNPKSVFGAVGFAGGVWVADSTSSVKLHDGVTVESLQGDVAVSADSETTAGGTARVAQNLDQGLGKKDGTPANPNNIAFAFGIASTSTTATARVEDGASVIAETGNVSITSSGTDEIKVYPEARSYAEGRVGVTIGLEFSESDIRTLINGTVRAGGADAGKALTFDPFVALDTDADTIDLGPDHGYETGDKIFYSAELGGAIDGLESNTAYYVIVDENNPDLIRLAASKDNAFDGTAIDFAGNPALVSADGTRSLAFTSVGDVSDWIDFGFAHGFAAGDEVVYQAADGKRVSGLVDGATYYVVLVDGDDDGTLLQLATDPDGVDIVDLDTSPTFTVASSGRELTVASIDEGSNVVTFTEDHGLVAGDEIRFHPTLGFQLTNQITEERYDDGTAFYAIPAPLVDDPGQLEPTQIRLADSQDKALTSNGFTNSLTLLTDSSVMRGTGHVIEPTKGSGITASSSMDGDHSLESKARIGGSESFVKQWTHIELGAVANKFRSLFYDNAANQQLAGARNNDNPLDETTDNTKTGASGSLGYMQLSGTVATVIGSSAVLQSGTDVGIHASSIETGNIIVESGATQTKKSDIKTDIGAAVAVATHDTTVRAIVNDGASIDAIGEISVKATNERTLPTPVDSASGLFEGLLHELESEPAEVVGALNKSLLFPLFTTGWAYTHVAPEGASNAVGFAMQLAFYDNTTEAVIAAGAQINQDEAYRGIGQSVKVHAETTTLLANMAGVFKFGLGLGTLIGDAIVGLGFENLAKSLGLKSHPLAEVGVEGKAQAYGLSFQWTDVTSKTIAAVGGVSPVDDEGDTPSSVPSGIPARVHTGSDGLSVTAHEDLWYFGFVDTGAKTLNEGAKAFAGSIGLMRYNPDQDGKTEAMIGAGTVVTGGPVKVKATDSVIQVGQNGSFITGDNTTGVGVGVNYFEISRKVHAYIGDPAGTSSALSSFSLEPGSTISVEAESAGFTVSFVLASTVRTDAAPVANPNGQQNAPNAVNDDANSEEDAQVGQGANSGQSGWSLAGDASDIDIRFDQVLAFIDDLGTFDAEKVSVTAKNDNDYVNLAGAFAITRTEKDASSNTGLAGSFSGIQMHRGDEGGNGHHASDTLAYISRATLGIAAGGLVMSADRRGLYWVTAAGGSGNARGSGVEVAGSAAWTDLDYGTRAFLDRATVTLAGDSRIEATDRVATVALAGDAVWGGSVGFGTSWAWNQVDRRVHSTITDSSITQTAGTLSLESVNWDIAKDDGRTLLPSAYAVAATIGVGNNSSSAELTGTVAVNEFNTRAGNNAVEASMTASSYEGADGNTADTGLSLATTDNTNLVAVAGGGALGGNFTLGVAAAVNELHNKAASFIENSTVAVSGGDVGVTANMNPEANAFALGIAVSDQNNSGVFAGSGAANRLALTADAHIKGADDGTGQTDTAISGAANITVQGDISYTDVTAGAGTFGVQADVTAGAAFGAAVAVNDLSNNNISAFVEDAVLAAAGDITVQATTGMATDGIILGLAVGGEGAAQFSLGGSVVKNTVKPMTDAHVSGDLSRLSAGGDVTVAASEENLAVAAGTGVVSVAFSSSGSVATGAAVATNVVDSTVTGYIDVASDSEDPAVTATGAVAIEAKRKNPRIVAVAAGGESANTFDLGGSVATNDVTHATDAHVTGSAYVSGAAGATVMVEETNPSIVAAAGNIDVAQNGIAIGAAVSTNTVNRSLKAYVGNAGQGDVDDNGTDGSQLISSGGSVGIQASRNDSLVLSIGVSGEGADTFAGGGSAATNDIHSSSVDAHVWGGTLDGDAGVTVQAADTRATNIAGAGNVDLNFLFQSGGSEAGGESVVDSQDYVENANEEADADEAGSDNIDGQQQAVNNDNAQIEEINPQEISASDIDLEEEDDITDPLNEAYSENIGANDSIDPDPLPGNDTGSPQDPAALNASAGISGDV